MTLKGKLIMLALLALSLAVNWMAYARADTPPEDPWGQVVDEDGHLLTGNLVDLGEVQVTEDWMPDLPFVEGQATFHAYQTPDGDIVLLPSATTLFFMALDPGNSGLNAADSALGNGTAALEMMLAGYLTAGDLERMGYTDPQAFFQAVTSGQENIWTFGGEHMLNFLSDLLSNSLADGNYYTLLLLYTRGNCAAVPGGCPAGANLPTPVPSGTCPPGYITAGPIRLFGASDQGGKVAPPNPVVIGQDPEQRGVDLEVGAFIPPVLHHTFNPVHRSYPVCAPDPTGRGPGCPAHPGDPAWKTVTRVETQCLEQVRAYPDLLESARLTVSLTEDSRRWILQDLAQAYPGARLLHPDFAFSLPGGGALQGDQAVSWTGALERLPAADPGEYATRLSVTTRGTPVSAPRTASADLGTFPVALVRVTLIEAP